MVQSVYFFHRPNINYNKLPSEANLLREAATVIAISEANADSLTLETVADPDWIVNVGFDGMIDEVVHVLCTPKELPPTPCEYEPTSNICLCSVCVHFMIFSL